MMQRWPGQGEYQNSLEWQKYESFSRLLSETMTQMSVAPEREWILEVLRESESKMARSIEDGQDSVHLAEYILSLDTVRSFLVIVDYCMRFLVDLDLVDSELAARLEAGRADFEALLTSRTQTLRETLRNEWHFTNN